LRIGAASGFSNRADDLGEDRMRTYSHCQRYRVGGHDVVNDLAFGKTIVTRSRPEMTYESLDQSIVCRRTSAIFFKPIAIRQMNDQRTKRGVFCPNFCHSFCHTRQRRAVNGLRGMRPETVLRPTACASMSCGKNLEAKKRPVASDPLIVHLPNRDWLKKIAMSRRKLID